MRYPSRLAECQSTDRAGEHCTFQQSLATSISAPAHAQAGVPSQLECYYAGGHDVLVGALPVCGATQTHGQPGDPFLSGKTTIVNTTV